MRWMWIDRILELDKGRRCVTVKNISLAEEQLRDHFPRLGDRDSRPLQPAPLIIEGMAQTAGILVGHVRGFKEKVILAKIGKATFDCDVSPGMTLFFEANIVRLDDAGAATSGAVFLMDHSIGSTERVKIGEIDLMFSHIDRNLRGLPFPEHNFVFTDQFFDLMRNSNIPLE